VQAVAGEQGAQAAAPLANEPTGHVAAVNAQEVAPATLYAPAAQGRHAAEELAPGEGEKVPAAQGAHVEGAAAPKKALYVPARQPVQTALEAAPVALDHVPAAQGVAFTEYGGQKKPAGHSAGAPEAQKKEAGQGVQVSWRILWLNKSVTKSCPLASTATPAGP
jgi:hypothetical protein